MDRRKFRLSSQKNVERKWCPKRLELASHLVMNIPEQEIEELFVRLSLRMYVGATVPSFHVLCERIKTFSAMVGCVQEYLTIS